MFFEVTVLAWSKYATIFLNINEKISLAFCYEVKRECGKESYIDECTRKERMGIIWLKGGIWKWCRNLREEGVSYVWGGRMLKIYC
jgi:hypothetical protein